MERLLYESKGAPTRATTSFVIILHTTMGTKRIALKNRERAREVFQWIQYLLQQYPVQRY